MNPWSAPIEKISFDLDGTLLGSRKLVCYILFVFNYLCLMRPRLRVWPALLLLKNMRQAAEMNSKEASVYNCDRAIAIFQAAMQCGDARDFYHDILKNIFINMKLGFYPIPTARQLLASPAVSRRFVVLATNPVWPLDIVKMRLSWGGITSDSFRFMSHGENMRHSKKSSQYYRDLLQETAANPVTTLHIGDSVSKDAHAANCGMRVFLITPWYKQPWRRWQIFKRQLPSQLIRIGSLNDLIKFFKDLK